MTANLKFRETHVQELSPYIHILLGYVQENITQLGLDCFVQEKILEHLGFM